MKGHSTIEDGITWKDGEFAMAFTLNDAFDKFPLINNEEFKKHADVSLIYRWYKVIEGSSDIEYHIEDIPFHQCGNLIDEGFYEPDSTAKAVIDGLHF